jgi:DNA-binding LacI/PurR family transcriptional regulator
MQVTYLSQRERQQIVFAAPERADLQRLAQAHLQGVRQECARLSLEPPLVRIVPFSRVGAREVIADLLAQQSPPFGVCCYNDEVAFAVIAALSDAGIRIPASVAVIGCDDIPLAQFSIPPLTTIILDQSSLPDHLIENILAASHGEALKEMPPKHPSLVVRGST